MYLSIVAVERNLTASIPKDLLSAPMFYAHVHESREVLVRFLNAESSILDHSHKCTSSAFQSLENDDLIAAKVKEETFGLTGQRYVRCQVVCCEGDTVMVNLPDYVRFQFHEFQPAVVEDVSIDCIRLFDDTCLSSYDEMPAMGRVLKLDEDYRLAKLWQLREMLANEVHQIISFSYTKQSVSSELLPSVCLHHHIFEKLFASPGESIATELSKKKLGSNLPLEDESNTVASSDCDSLEPLSSYPQQENLKVEMPIYGSRGRGRGLSRMKTEDPGPGNSLTDASSMEKLRNKIKKKSGSSLPLKDESNAVASFKCDALEHSTSFPQEKKLDVKTPTCQSFGRGGGLLRMEIGDPASDRSLVEASMEELRNRIIYSETPAAREAALKELDRRHYLS